MADQEKDASNGGKFPNREPNSKHGMAIEEFVNEAAVNRPADDEKEPTKPGDPPTGVKFRVFGADGERSKLAATMETALANPLLLVAAAAALPLLALFWGLSRRKKRSAREDDYDIGL